MIRVCLICAEFFGWGSRGGFGYATRIIGRELIRLGVTVFAVVPRPRDLPAKRVEFDGIQVVGVDRSRPFSAMEIYREIDADIYHSQQPSLASWMAQRSMPDRLHLATLRDPRSLKDWWQEVSHPTHNPAQVFLTWLYYENPLTHRAIHRMDGLYTPAHYLRQKSQRLYGLPTTPDFLPTPVVIPEQVQKAQRPTVCFVGRWDRVKRPELFFDLAKDFPDVEFLAIGKAHNLGYERNLRERYCGQDNLKLIGFIDQFASDALSGHLGRSWVLVNTSAKEALPNTFIEACAHRCAIVSAQNPDDFATRFGRHVQKNDFSGALRDLLQDERWRRHGQAGYEYVLATNALSAAAQRHLETYKKLLSANGRKKYNPGYASP